jgi:hypothetical protein
VPPGPNVVQSFVAFHVVSRRLVLDDRRVLRTAAVIAEPAEDESQNDHDKEDHQERVHAAYVPALSARQTAASGNLRRCTRLTRFWLDLNAVPDR